MMVSGNNSDGVPVLLPFTKLSPSGKAVGFIRKDGKERWLEHMSIIGGMPGVIVLGGTAPRTVFLKVRKDIFKRRRDELQDFVCDTGVPVSLRCTQLAGRRVAFLDKDGKERWLEETSIVGGMSGLNVQMIVSLKVTESTFKKRKDIQGFVCDT